MKTLYIALSLAIAISGCTNKSSNISGSGKAGDSSIAAIKDTFHPAGADNRQLSIVKPQNVVHEITVGGGNADVRGYTSVAIQLAVDALHNQHGGTVKLLPGNFDIIAPVRLYSNISLVGSGITTVLTKCRGVRTQFVADADYGELKLTVEDARGFTPGMGIQVYDSTQNSGWDVTTAVITAIEGNIMHFDNYLVRDYLASKAGTVTNACSVISAVETENVTIANLTVDGSRQSNFLIDGCRAGGIYLHKVKNALVENVTVKNFNCDGISWQITEDITVRNCEVFGCANAGLHPGTGSPRSVIEGNNCHDNDNFGMFICWRVCDGFVRNNRFHHNKGYGICTGHKDTNMLFENNHIFENAIDGVNFRSETRANAPHRNVFRNNLVENNGTRNGGYGFSFNSPAEGVILENNIIRNTGGGKQTAAVCIYPNGLPVTLKNNQISGHLNGDVVKGKNSD